MSICGRTSNKKQVHFDPDTKTKSFSTPRHKPNQFRSLNWTQVKFYPSHLNQVDIDQNQTKTKSISMLTLKPSDSRPASKNESISTTTTHPKNKSIDHHTWNKLVLARTRSISTPRTKNKSFSILSLKPSHFRSLTRKSSQLGRHNWIRVEMRSPLIDPHSKIKSFSMSLHKNKLILIHTLAIIFFRPPRKNQVNFDPYTKFKSISIPTVIHSILTPRHQNQVDFDTFTKTKYVRPPQKNKSIPIPTLKSSEVRSPTWTSEFRSQH